MHPLAFVAAAIGLESVKIWRFLRKGVAVLRYEKGDVMLEFADL